MLPEDLDFLVGIYAFGAMLAFTLAHLSVIVLRYREPDRDRPYAMPLSIRVGGGLLPLPAVLGAVLSFAGWIGVLVDPPGGADRRPRLDGRRTRAVRHLPHDRGQAGVQAGDDPRAGAAPGSARRSEFGSILVPLLGTPLDDDIVQTAGRLAAEERSDEGEQGAVIEALWVFQIPMSLPLDAALPEHQLQEARRGAGAGQGGGGGVRGRRGGDGHGAGAPGRPGDRRRGAQARASRRS